MPVAAFLMTTDAPGTTPPVASWTTPVTLPFVLTPCANARELPRATSATVNTSLCRLTFMRHPPSSLSPLVTGGGRKPPRPCGRCHTVLGVRVHIKRPGRYFLPGRCGVSCLLYTSDAADE